jgi:hypothetical protein
VVAVELTQPMLIMALVVGLARLQILWGQRF